MGITVEGAKLKWRGLRDTFRKEMFKNAKNARRGQESGWIYYQQMKFVTNHCRKSKCGKRNKNELKYQAPEVKEEEFVHEYQDSVDSVCSSPIVFELCEPAEQQPKAAPRHESVVPVNAFPSESPARAPYEPEQTVQSLQINSSTSISEEADYYFLMSLLPYLRKVPTNRKMLVRTKLQQVFCDEEARS
ncbi:uncharacterized protein LOC131207286 [Anopheles bellator]|uniref:uncharacterized protein LOC131207286 n=1 Tax=Anopheles bellator TaxID=139047 RepID=UPI0026497E06|nr:uncharacterized protein LOC131207286 [Anopheles bellator]